MALNITKSSATSMKSVDTSETTPLLQTHATAKESPRKWPKSVVYRVLVTAFLVSLSFGITQVPLLYLCTVMTCDEYYRKNPSPPLGTPAWDARCSIRTIEAGAAQASALLGTLTMVFGVANLFVTGWLIKAWGIKPALLLSVFWPAMRLVIQNFGVMTGAGTGMIIIQASQAMTIIGGPSGYLLALNSFATEIVLPAERTATLGVLSGCAMFGTAFGYLSGGLLSDWFGIITPFRVTLAMFCISSLYTALALPTIPTSSEIEKKATTSLGAFFDPLKMFIPRTWMLRNGQIRLEYGVTLLGTGAFLAVFATGTIPTLLQLYSTDLFDFGTTDNSELISLNFVIRATFLTFVFPQIIKYGRRWTERRGRTNSDRMVSTRHSSFSHVQEEGVDVLPTEPQQLSAAALPPGQEAADEPDPPALQVPTADTPDEENESFEFDLLYTRWSLLLDGIFTFFTTFTTKGWHVYIVASIIPLAAGTGSAAKGVMLQMCAPDQKTDALSAISLLELVARMSTISVFGLVFSFFAQIDRHSLTFAANAGVAIVGFIVLMFARFPPEGAVRYTKDTNVDGEHAGDGE